MCKQVLLVFISTIAVTSASPAEAPKAIRSIKFSGSFEDARVSSLKLESPSGSSLERRRASLNGDVALCSDTYCASGCVRISTSGGGPSGQCEFTLPNPFFSFGLINSPVGTFYPFTIGINLAPAPCPNNLFHLTEANVCFNVPGDGKGGPSSLAISLFKID